MDVPNSGQSSTYQGLILYNTPSTTVSNPFPALRGLELRAGVPERDPGNAVLAEEDHVVQSLTVVCASRHHCVGDAVVFVDCREVVVRSRNRCPDRRTIDLFFFWFVCECWVCRCVYLEWFASVGYVCVCVWVFEGGLCVGVDG